MASIIYQPCYATREEVQRALDVKAAAYNAAQIDRQIVAASDSVEDLCKRRFYPSDETRKFDWPNFQYTFPWNLWLDQHELAGQPTLFVSGSLLVTPKVIPVGSYICRPINTGPPFTHIELRRDMNSAFGNNPTPQLDIAVTGPFGFWMKTTPVGVLAAAITDTTSTGVQVSLGPGAGAGTGDVLIADSERMIVQDASYISTGIVTAGGATTVSAADNTIGVPSGAAFSVGENIILDSETMLIQYIIGNNLVVKRAWEGSVLATHSAGATVWARRQLTVLRGQLGTTAAIHSNAAPLTITQVPGLVKQMAVAEALVGMIQEPGGYTSGLPSSLAPTANSYGGTGRGQQREPIPGIGLGGLRDRVLTRYGRKARSRVV